MGGSHSNPDGRDSHIEAESDTREEASENLFGLLEEGQNVVVIPTDSPLVGAASGRMASCAADT